MLSWWWGEPSLGLDVEHTSCLTRQRPSGSWLWFGGNVLEETSFQTCLARPSVALVTLEGPVHTPGTPQVEEAWVRKRKPLSSSRLWHQLAFMQAVYLPTLFPHCKRGTLDQKILIKVKIKTLLYFGLWKVLHILWTLFPETCTGTSSVAYTFKGTIYLPKAIFEPVTDS